MLEVESTEYERIELDKSAPTLGKWMDRQLSRDKPRYTAHVKIFEPENLEYGRVIAWFGTVL